MNIRIETTIHSDSEGREYLQFTPVATFRPLASGELRMAVWQAYLDEPNMIATQKAKAMEMARSVIRSLAKEFPA